MNAHQPEILTAIFNHNCNQKAITLKKKLDYYFKPILIDSGSQLLKDEEVFFDIKLPNVYYNGLINKAHELLTSQHTHLFVITSDVDIPDPQLLANRMKEILTLDYVGVYAPSVDNTTHNHMHNKKSGGIRKVTFTDGFCYVIPAEFLHEVCPIDLEVNSIGHATDMYMGYLGMVYKKYAVVDDLVTVNHPRGSGYSPVEARKQRDNWFATKSRKARFYHFWISMDWLKNRIGFFIMLLIMKILGRRNP